MANFANLKVLNLESNDITDWDEINNDIRKFPSLESLLLSKNKITHISYIDGFQALKSIYLSKNQIGKYQSLNELNKFPAL